MVSKPSQPTTATEALQAWLPAYRQRIESALEAILPPADTLPFKLHEAMRYAVLGNGKRLRPVLVYATGNALKLDYRRLDGPAVAVELIHAYSLVHDDLPSMDDDDLRRGQPTCHRAFDEATAILVGDALQTLAFRSLAEGDAADADAEARLRMVASLSLASGSRGMVGGQALDLAAEGRELSLAELEDLHIHKTGALIRASVMLGALCRSDVDRELLERLDSYAKCIGLAFQIHDDILDVAGDTEQLGKACGADAAHEKATYPGLLGLQESREHAELLIERALRSLEPFDEDADCLRAIARYTIERQH